MRSETTKKKMALPYEIGDLKMSREREREREREAATNGAAAVRSIGREQISIRREKERERERENVFDDVRHGLAESGKRVAVIEADARIGGRVRQSTAFLDRMLSS